MQYTAHGHLTSRRIGELGSRVLISVRFGNRNQVHKCSITKNYTESPDTQTPKDSDQNPLRTTGVYRIPNIPQADRFRTAQLSPLQNQTPIGFFRSLCSDRLFRVHSKFGLLESTEVRFQLGDLFDLLTLPGQTANFNAINL